MTSCLLLVAIECHTTIQKFQGYAKNQHLFMLSMHLLGVIIWLCLCTSLCVKFVINNSLSSQDYIRNKTTFSVLAKQSCDFKSFTDLCLLFFFYYFPLEQTKIQKMIFFFNFEAIRWFCHLTVFIYDNLTGIKKRHTFFKLLSKSKKKKKK